MIKKTVIGLCALLSIAAIIATVYTVKSDAQDNEKGGHIYPATKVAVAKVEESLLARTLSGVGELEAAKQVFVAAETNGRIIGIDFNSGQQVKKGQRLVQLNDAVEQGELARLHAQLRNAQQLHSRTTQLFNKNMVAAAQVDSTRAEQDMAKGAIRQTQALIAQKSITAPFDGVIGIRQVHEGQYLNAGDPIATLINAETLKLNFSLDEQATPNLYIGQSVDILVDAYSGQIFPATIIAIDPLIGKSRTVQIQAELTNQEGKLKAGMYASVQVTPKNRDHILTVPETAVTYTAYGDTVFIIKKNEQNQLTAQRVAVKVGQRFQGKIEIIDGLNAGQNVITSGQLKLNDGSAVQLLKQDTLASHKPQMGES